VILCKRCWTLWSKGTIWCGKCRSTMGSRHCPEGHVSPLLATACVTCGSTKLTPGVRALNFRPITLISVTLACFALSLTVLPQLIENLQRVAWRIFDSIMSIGIALAMLSFVLWQPLSRECKDSWGAIGMCILKSTALLCKGFVSLVRVLAQSLQSQVAQSTAKHHDIKDGKV